MIHLIFMACICSRVLCGHFVLPPGDQFHQGGVQREHADRRYLPEGGVLLQGRCSAGSLFQCNKRLETVRSCGGTL